MGGVLTALCVLAVYILACFSLHIQYTQVFHDEPDHTELFYFGWCHGPAGAALSTTTISTLSTELLLAD